jgi:hypothetical protein
VKRHKEDAFALIAVNCHDNQEEFLEGQGEIKTDYASIFGGAPIASDWGVNAFPTMFILDAEGKIRFKGVRGEALDEAVQELLDELTEESSK